jgi:mRNA-degrading endonuclease RelE of RelBE toxin-antitoxin system
VAYQITISGVAESQLKAMPARDRRTIEDGVFERLPDHPNEPTRAIKQRRPNPVAPFELRLGDLRVLYNVIGEEVILIAVGRKVGNRLIIDGKEFNEHQRDPGGPPAP